MRILFFSNPFPRCLLPLLPLARALRRHGHEVSFATAPEASPWLERESFELILFGPDSYELTAETARRAGLDILFSSAMDITVQLFAGTRVDLLVDEARGLAEHWAPDLIVSEHRDLVGPLVATALKVPCAVAVTSSTEPEELDALTATVRSRCLAGGFQPPALVPYGRWLLDLCPPSLQARGWPPSPDRMALRPESHLGWAWQSRSRETVGTGRPRVLVGFDAEEDTSLELGPVIRSLRTLDVDLLVAGGEKGVGARHWETDRIQPSPGFPAIGQLEAVSAVMHHGGPDITLAAAACGIPAVVVPESPEQQRQAERFAATGAGIALPARKQDPASISASLDRLLSDSGFNVAASRLRDEIAAMPTAGQVARRLVDAVAAERGRWPPATDGPVVLARNRCRTSVTPDEFPVGGHGRY